MICALFEADRAFLLGAGGSDDIGAVELGDLDRGKADAASGTASKNQAIWIESADSVGFSMGFTCTSFIPEEQAAIFARRSSVEVGAPRKTVSRRCARRIRR